MKKQTNSNWQKQMLFAALAAFVFIFGASSNVAAQGKFKTGDRVECDVTGSGKYWEKGTVLAFKDRDMYNGYLPDSGYFYRVRLDRHADGEPDGRFCKSAEMRPLAAAAAEQTKNENAGNTPAERQTAPPEVNKTAAKLRVDENGTVLPDRELLECPIEQPQAKNGDRPDPKIVAKLIRCLWEKPAAKGLDGAMTVDVTTPVVGTPRKWNPLNDLGNGNLQTIVYPVKTSFTWRTFYRRRITVSEFTGVFNCYVNPFGEWQCGLSDSKQKGETTSIPVQ